MIPNTTALRRGKSAVIALFAAVWRLACTRAAAIHRWLHRTAVRVSGRSDRNRRSRPTAMQPPLADEPVLSPATGVRGRIGHRLAAGARSLSPPAIAMVGLVAMTGLAAAAQSSTGGVCGTPVIDVFEWSTRTGGALLLLAGFVYGAYKHARAAMTPNPERANRHRRTGTISMFSGPIFWFVILFATQAAGAAGITAAECADLIPWF